MAEVPGRLVGDAESPLDLVRAHALPGLAEQVDAQKPLPQRQMGVVEDRPCRHRELVPASIAVELVPLRNLGGLPRATAGACRPLRPAKGLKVLAALFLAAKLLNQSTEINGVFHV